MAPPIDDPHFRQFALALEKAIAACGETSAEGFFKRQKRQVDTLVALERSFKEALIANRRGEEVFQAFMHHICETRRNILDARPYFRERQHTFTRYISGALRRGDVKALHRFRYNFRFVQFVLNARPWKHKSAIARLGREITAVRNELITMNMPLAISRARIFYSRTPKAHLQYMDLIQIACEGLMSGVDKFVPPFSRAFRGVAIGRMTGNFIENYSETFIHFYPVDKRKLYRANKLVGRQGEALDYPKLAKSVNKGVKELAHRTTPAEIADLMAAASIVSADTQTPGYDDDESNRVTDRFAAPDDCRPDVIVERQDTLAALVEAAKDLTVFDRKLLKLKGVQI